MTTTPHPGTLRVADLPEAERAWLVEQRYDRFVEKHEGPFTWGRMIVPSSYEAPDREGGRRTVHVPPAEFLSFDGRDVLLPVNEDHHPNLHRLRTVVSDDGRCLTIFMLDTTYDQGTGAGRFAFCEKAPQGGWYLCTVWHEWYAPR